MPKHQSKTLIPKCFIPTEFGLTWLFCDSVCLWHMVWGWLAVLICVQLTIALGDFLIDGGHWSTESPFISFFCLAIQACKVTEWWTQGSCITQDSCLYYKLSTLLFIFFLALNIQVEKKAIRFQGQHSVSNFLYYLQQCRPIWGAEDHGAVKYRPYNPTLCSKHEI